MARTSKEKKSISKAPADSRSLEEIKDALKAGMTIRVYQKIKELNPKGEEKERLQYFDGMVIARKHGKEAGATITVRKISDGISVEKIYPLALPSIAKIEIMKQAEVRRAKLYYLRRGYTKRLKDKKLA